MSNRNFLFSANPGRYPDQSDSIGEGLGVTAVIVLYYAGTWALEIARMYRHKKPRSLPLSLHGFPPVKDAYSQIGPMLSPIVDPFKLRSRVSDPTPMKYLWPRMQGV